MSPFCVKRISGILLLCSILLLIGTGCSGSDQSQKEQPPASQTAPTATEVVQQQIAALHQENDSLRQMTMKLQEENRTLESRLSGMTSAMESLKTRTSMPPPATVSDGLEGYKQALALFFQGSYRDAASTFQGSLTAGVPDRLKDNCCYWIGECLYGMNEYDAAIDQFRKVFSFERSEKKDDAQMMIANAYLAMRNTSKAKEEFERLLKTFPASPYVKRAKEKLAGL